MSSNPITPTPQVQKILDLVRRDCQASPRRIDLLVLHCTDTRPDQDFTIEKLRACHRARGFGQWPGYHLYVRRDGTLYYCRPVSVRGCHVKGHNEHSIGLCYEGGHRGDRPWQRPGRCPTSHPAARLPHHLRPESPYEDNRTAEQLITLYLTVMLLRQCYPAVRVVGHHELNPHKACPCIYPPVSIEYGQSLSEIGHSPTETR